MAIAPRGFSPTPLNFTKEFTMLSILPRPSQFCVIQYLIDKITKTPNLKIYLNVTLKTYGKQKGITDIVKLIYLICNTQPDSRFIDPRTYHNMSTLSTSRQHNVVQTT